MTISDGEKGFFRVCQPVLFPGEPGYYLCGLQFIDLRGSAKPVPSTTSINTIKISTQTSDLSFIKAVSLRSKTSWPKKFFGSTSNAKLSESCINNERVSSNYSKTDAASSK